jgi:hypothetical protein
VRVEVVSENMGVKKNGAKTRATRNYSPTCPKAKLQSMHLWVGISYWGKATKFKLADKAWACKTNSSCKFSPSPAKKCLTQIRISLCPVVSPQGRKARYHWGNKRNKNQITTLYGSCASLYNGKQNVIYTSRHRLVGMQLYKRRRQKPKWKDSRTSNVETQIQANINESWSKERY